MTLSFGLNRSYLKTKKSALPQLPKTLSPAEAVADEVMHLFDAYGAAACKNGAVTQSAHMIQCALLAMENISDLPLVIGALLHDIGCLLQEKELQTIAGVDMENQAASGAAYLRSKGFSARVCAIVEQQAAARWYLATTDAVYRNRVSQAELKSMRCEGGSPDANERAVLEQAPYFTDIIKVAYWDMDATDKKAALLPVAFFRKLVLDHLFYRI